VVRDVVGDGGGGGGGAAPASRYTAIGHHVFIGCIFFLAFRQKYRIALEEIGFSIPKIHASS